MPSPATRSGRLTKSNENKGGEKESKDVTNTKTKAIPSSPKASAMPGRTSSRKSSGSKSPITSQEMMESSPVISTRSRRSVNQSLEGNHQKTMAEEVETAKDNAVEIDVSKQNKPSKSKISTLDMSVKAGIDNKKSDVDLKKSSVTPTSTPGVRRSSRAPVPSSRFKDMEMALTPTSQKSKRTLAASSPGDSVQEPSHKRIRKNSTKIDDPDKERPHPTPKPDNENKDGSSSSSQILMETPLQKDDGSVAEETVQKETSCDVGKSSVPLQTEQNFATEQSTVLLQTVKSSSEKGTEMCLSLDTNDRQEVCMSVDTNDRPEEEKVNSVAQSLSNDNQSEKNSEYMESTERDPPVELPTDNNVNHVIEASEVTIIKDADGSKTEDQNTFVSPDVSFSTTVDVPESISQEVSVEEVGLSCQDGGLIVEETVHTYMDEKDVVIQNTAITPHLDNTVEEVKNVGESSKKIELTLDKDATAAISSSLLKGQGVTVQERNGKMVAIVKIPGTFSSLQSSPVQSEVEQQREEPTYLLSSNAAKSVLNSGGSTTKSRHGTILNAKDKLPFITFSDEHHNTINVTVEPTTMHSLLKPKPSESLTKPTTKSNFGRVIKQEAGTSNTNTHVSPIQNTPNSLVIKKAGANQKISLLPSSMKATNPKESKPYSLLSSPSELLQKLKGDFEKKPVPATGAADQPQEATTLSPPPKKVVIIAHQTKPGDQIEQSSEPSLLKDDGHPVVESEIVEPNEATSETTEIAMGSQSKPEEISVQAKLLDDSTMEVVEETTSDPDKIEEIVDSGTLSGIDGVGQQDKSEEISTGEMMDSSSDIRTEDVIGQELNGEEFAKDKEELLIEAAEAFSHSGEDIDSDLLISNEVDKSTVEETVITSAAQAEVDVKQEIDAANNDSLKEGEEEKSEDHPTSKGKDEAPSGKSQRIKLVDNGVVYELQIVSDGETRALQVQDDGIEFDGVNNESIVVKQEIVDEDGNTSTDTLGKSTLGTQTVYGSKRGRPRSSSEKDDTDATVHKLATIVQEGGQKKHFYYVSVVPGKTMDGKYRRSVEHILPGCVVSDSGEYCCKECDYKTDKKANFYKHRRLHTGSKPHVCHVCKYQARTSSNLKRHMGIHDDIREFKCTQCSLSFRQKIHLERHIRYRHEEKRVKCPMCDYVCANEQPDLKMHIKRKHTQESGKVFTCPQCNIEVGSKRDLKQHLKFHKDGPELKLFCKECSFVTDCKSRLQRHLVVHSNVKPYHCGVCDYKATQKEHVVRHLRSQHKIEVNKPKRPWKKQTKQEAGASVGGNSRGDFTCGDKIFACNHCSMRFAKLINLYKHLHTQHTDIMPAETESNYYCVVCEFSTSSKKNLLIHMRRHNMTDQTPPTHVYSCVLCRYVNPRRRNLFQHMRKKHNIDISTQVDIAGMTAEEEAAVRQEGGDKITDFIKTEQGVFGHASSEEVASTSTFENVDGATTQVIKDNLAGVANMIKIQDLTRVAAGGDAKDNSATSLVIDTHGDGTQLVQATSLMQHKAADAIEGLQALAGQAGLIIDEEVATIETKPSIVIDQSNVGVINAADATTLGDGTSIILSAGDHPSIVEEQVAANIEDASSEQIQHIVESVVESVEAAVNADVDAGDAGAGLTTSVELTEEQLSSLHHGDIVQMEGQVYMVELAQDPDSPDKQLLSFLPINQG